MSDHDARLECGRTLEEVSALLDGEGSLADPHFAQCPHCQNAYDLLAGPGGATRALIEADAHELPEPTGNWISGIMDAIALDLRSGRSLPVSHPDPRVEISIDEGAVKALLRSVGDRIDGVVVGRVQLNGDVEELGAPVEVVFTVSVAWGRSIPEVTDALRAAAAAALHRHTELEVSRIDISVVDLHGLESKESA